MTEQVKFAIVERATPAKRATRFDSLRSAAIKTAKTGKALKVSGMLVGALRGSLYSHAKRLGLQVHINKYGDYYEVWCEPRNEKK